MEGGREGMEGGREGGKGGREGKKESRRKLFCQHYIEQCITFFKNFLKPGGSSWRTSERKS